MVGILSLWLPILVSAVLVFVVSSVIHTVLPWHKNDYPKIPGEDRVMEALRPLAIPPGDYMVPRCESHAEMRTPAFTEKLNKGPVMMVTVLPNGMSSMAASFIGWIVYLLVVGVFCAYVAGRALTIGSPYLDVFRFAGTVAFVAHSVAIWQMSIWYWRGWGITIKATIDGLIYALLTAGVFGWLWPR